MTLGYALFQTADNTAVAAGVPTDRRGVTSGMLNLSRNLGLLTEHPRWVPCSRSQRGRRR